MESFTTDGNRSTMEAGGENRFSIQNSGTAGNNVYMKNSLYPVVKHGARIAVISAVLLAGFFMLAAGNGMFFDMLDKFMIVCRSGKAGELLLTLVGAVALIYFKSKWDWSRQKQIMAALKEGKASRKQLSNGGHESSDGSRAD
jgi:hypothetical protein